MLNEAKETTKTKIAVIGLWHLGEIYSACLAEMGFDVIGIDEDEAVIKALHAGKPPLAEPQLDVLIDKHIMEGNLVYSSSFDEISGCDVVWFTYDTPVLPDDSADTSVIFKGLEKVLPHLKQGSLIVVSSQLPVGTSNEIIKQLKQAGKEIDYAYVPENLRLGEAVENFLHPERVIVGGSSDTARARVSNLLEPLQCEIQNMDATSAEMVKHALNAFLATSLSFIYDIADTCEAVGGDIVAVSKALKSDPRIGERAYLDSSIGFAGGTLGRDLRYLEETAKKFNFTVPVISSVYEKNASRRRIILKKLEPLGELQGKTVAILGLTYKAGTTTLRRSLSLELAELLHEEGVHVVLYDKFVPASDVTDAYDKGSVIVGDRFPEVLSGCEAAILVTPWDEILESDWDEVAATMAGQKLFIDGRNYLYEHRGKLTESGLNYCGVGVV